MVFVLVELPFIVRRDRDLRLLLLRGYELLNLATEVGDLRSKISLQIQCWTNFYAPSSFDNHYSPRRSPFCSGETSML